MITAICMVFAAGWLFYAAKDERDAKRVRVAAAERRLERQQDENDGEADPRKRLCKRSKLRRT